MTWEELFPHVLTSAPNCPDDTAIRALRTAAIEFCQRSNAWRRTLDAITADGVSNSFLMTAPDDTAILKLYAVSVNGRDYNRVEPGKGMALVRTNFPGEFAFTRDRKNVEIYPLQDVGTTIEVDVSLAPTLEAGELDAELDEHALKIAHGALAIMLRMPKTDWTDLKLADYYGTMFANEAKTMGLRASLGSMRASHRGSKDYF